MSKVAIIKGERKLDTVFDALELIPYREALTNWDRVLIKVNFITTKTWDTGATTDPVVVEAIIDKVRMLGKEAIVVESDAQMTNADKAFVKSGMKEMLDIKGVAFLNMRHVAEKVKIPVSNGKTLKSIKVAKIATDSAIVSAAKLKTHMNTYVTLGMKNMFGMLTTKWKGRYHLYGMDKVIHDVNKTLPPQLTVIDGFVAMEGPGPVNGRPVKMDLVIASTDPVAADATASRVMGFNPWKIDHIVWAYESGLGEIDDIEVCGEELMNVRRLFKRL
jgi:uncharacterized protein (DUF362 family)